MTRTFEERGGPAEPTRRASAPTPAERAIVLSGFVLAALCTAWSATTGAGLEPVAAAWLAAGAWAAVSSLTLALRRGLRRRDWSAFGGYRLPEDTELIDWSTKSGSWLDMAVAEENERLMRGD